MPLPANVNYGTIQGRFIGSDGTPNTGSVVFTPSVQSLKNVSSGVIILPTPKTVILDSSGEFSVELVATDDPDNNPVDWTYSVTFKLNSPFNSFNISVPQDTTQNLVSLAPVAASGGVAVIRGERGNGISDMEIVGGNLIVTLEDGTEINAGAVPVGSGGGGGGDVASVNGQTGVVVLDADDIEDGTSKKMLTAAERTKLSGIATGATANSSDATLLNRANHTGTQAQSTITNLTTDLAGKAAVSHTHPQSAITNLVDDLAGKAAVSHTHPATAISDSTATGRSVLTAASAADARTAIGAGTSNLALGTTSSTAKAGDYKPPVEDLPAGTPLTVVYNGTSWPARPTARTDIVVWWIDLLGTAPVPSGGVANLDVVVKDAGV